MRGLRIILVVAGLSSGIIGVANAGDQLPLDVELRMAPVPGVDIASTHVSKIVFLDNCKPDGCMLTSGANDARINRSSIVRGTSLVSPWRHSDEVWQELVKCVQELYAPYDIVVTDVDPGDKTFHHQAIVAGDWQEIGYEYPVGGVAPSQCYPANNVISFTFANGYSANAGRICAVVGQETAHSFGLEHVMDCSDPMTYLSSCGRQFFRDQATLCGEYEQLDNCQCGGSVQNSHRWLQTVLGTSQQAQVAPEVSLALPVDGTDVSGGFTISATATHMRGIGRVELVINGTIYETRDGHSYNQMSLPYTFSAPDDLADSILDVEIRAYDDIETETIAAATVTKGGPCGDASACNAGQGCEDGRCFWPAATGELGDACETDADCISGLCPNDGSKQLCSEWCFPTNTPTCPDGFTCLEIDINNGVCWPAGGGGGGGCSAGGSGGGFAALMMLAFALVAGRRRQSAVRT